MPRWMQIDQAKSVTLHGYASERAYGAVIYVRAINKNDKGHVNLFASKSRVAPSKRVTLARLELCAAELLAKLLVAVRNECNLTDAEYFLWSDSMIVWHCHKKPSSELKTAYNGRPI